MAYEHYGQTALDYLQCRYGKSRLLFRGPRRKLDAPFVAFFGGSEIYGKFVEEPFPDLIEGMTGTRCVNFGCMNAGADLFANDPTLLNVAGEAELTVVQIMGAQNMSNRFYAVHPRRNDRFLRASNLMKTVFREVDFTEFHFTRHMLSGLRRASEQKYAMVVDELKAAWVERMLTLLGKIEGKVVLLWVRDTRENGPHALPGGLGNDPLFVDSGMVDALRDKVEAVVEVEPSVKAWAMGAKGMAFTEMEAPAAAEMPNVGVHQEVAAALAPVIAELVE